ncbi:Na+/H+ antiporter [Streptomyces sp. NPDC058464]|uniref:Na+/H+ antiporter n=1 Tax=Streptomyces sp. NPDC058464 TaxID=3346511 RepID=UPI0036595231
MLGLELIVVLGVAILLCTVAGHHLRVAPPVLLLCVGVLLGFAPALREVHLPPEAMLLLFLPALLYWESLTTSLREIRRDLRGIVLVSTVLVIVTAWAVAAVMHALGLPWGPAWVLGAAVAPTDATAVEVVARLLPRRNLTLLRAESLVNDGTALVVYGLAVGVTVGSEHFSVPRVGGLFLLSYAGGIAAGALTAWLATLVRRHLDQPVLATTAVVLVPFVAFLLAEEIRASGVLAVVACGLIMSQVGPRVGRPDARLMAQEFWTVATFLLNGVLFVLVGLQVQSAVRGLTSSDLRHALIAVAAVSVVLVVVRYAFTFLAVRVIRLLDRRPQQRLRRMNERARVVGALSGFRGAVSLAVALSVPTALDSGEPFPGRDVIVFVTAGVIVVTLVVQGLLLPRVVRWARLPRDNSVEAERVLAGTTATEAALKVLPQVAAELGTDPDVVERLRNEYETHLRAVRTHGNGTDDDPDLRHNRQYHALRLALLAHKRAAVVRLRDERDIDDTVLRQVQRRLDIEEVRLTQRETTH